jgi:hypothetical protein
MNYGNQMDNISLKSNDVTNIVHRYYFYTQNIRIAKNHEYLQHLAPVSPTYFLIAFEGFDEVFMKSSSLGI